MPHGQARRHLVRSFAGSRACGGARHGWAERGSAARQTPDPQTGGWGRGEGRMADRPPGDAGGRQAASRSATRSGQSLGHRQTLVFGRGGVPRQTPASRRAGTRRPGVRRVGCRAAAGAGTNCGRISRRVFESRNGRAWPGARCIARTSQGHARAETTRHHPRSSGSSASEVPSAARRRRARQRRHPAGFQVRCGCPAVGG